MKTALFTFIVGRSSFIELKNAGRRSQFAGRSDSDAAARQQIQNNNIASSDPWLVNLPRLGPS